MKAGAPSQFAHLEKFKLSHNLLHPYAHPCVFFMVSYYHIALSFFYLREPLFPDYLQFKGNSVYELK